MDIMKHIITGILFIVSLSIATQAQERGEVRTGGVNMIYGDVKVDEGGSTELKPMALDILLYTETGQLVSRQTVQSNGRYRFYNVTAGRFQIVVEVENSEVARFTIDFSSPFKREYRQDIQLSWNGGVRPTKEVVSVADTYKRSGKNAGAFNKAMEAAEKKNYDGAVPLLRQILESDPKDFQAWEALGRVYFIQKNYSEAEKAYTEALKVHPDYPVVLISLGRLRISQKNFEGAVEALTQAVKLQPESAQANYFLGESYLQLKKGSKAVNYLYEALRLDPVGMADAHLLLGALYHGAGLKEKAAAEYEAFLKKRPDYGDKASLERYISANKKQ
jgi:Tfp pilus assembly protein PilF